MPNYSIHPVYDVNKYIWNQLKINNILIENDYVADGFNDPLVPIVPAQQIPEFNNLLPGQTYLIYDYEDMAGQENWWISNQLITYTIVSPNYDTITQIMALLKDSFRRHDESAKDLNKYSDISGYYDFHYISIDSSVSPQHFASEGGFMMGEVKLYVSYARHLDSNGRYQ
jgi:hypothetical protein